MGLPALSPAEALRLHRDRFVFDGHNDLALRLLDGEPFADRTGVGHMDLVRMRAGGLNGGVFALWIDPSLPGDPAERTLRGLERLRARLDAEPGVRVVLEVGDLDRAAEAGEVAAVLGVEGGYAIVDDLAMVDRLHAAGMRCLTLTWMRPTAWADAAGAEDLHGGLTPFGRRVVGRLRELGALVDVSHASDAATRDAIEATDGPVVASHSGVRAVSRHPRNLSDGLLEAIAETGGVVGVNFFSAYLDEAFGRGFAALQERMGPDGAWDLVALARACAAELAPVPFERLLAHVEHAVRVAGHGHVGIGSDFEGVAALPEGIRGVEDLPALSVALAARGFDADGLAAFLGASWRRVLHATLP